MENALEFVKHVEIRDKLSDTLLITVIFNATNYAIKGVGIHFGERFPQNDSFAETEWYELRIQDRIHFFLGDTT